MSKRGVLAQTHCPLFPLTKLRVCAGEPESNLMNCSRKLRKFKKKQLQKDSANHVSDSDSDDSTKRWNFSFFLTFLLRSTIYLCPANYCSLECCHSWVGECVVCRGVASVWCRGGGLLSWPENNRVCKDWSWRTIVPSFSTHLAHAAFFQNKTTLWKFSPTRFYSNQVFHIRSLFFFEFPWRLWRELIEKLDYLLK